MRLRISLALNKFCLGAIDYIPPLLYVPVVTMLTGSLSLFLTFSICIRHKPQYLLITSSMRCNYTIYYYTYYTNLRQERPNFKGGVADYKPAVSAAKSQNSQISPFETQGLESMLLPISNLCENCPDIVTVVVETSRWKLIYTLFGLITCRIQMSLKAKCIHPTFAPILWAYVEKYGLSDLSTNPSRLNNTGIIRGLEEFESKEGTFVKFINKILKFCPVHFYLELLIYV